MIRLLTGDCREVMATLPEASVDAIVTDPPYGIRFMGKAWDGADIERTHGISSPDGRSRQRTGTAAAGKYDLAPDAMLAFQEFSRAWAVEAFRVLKPGGHLLSFASTRTYHRMASGVEDAGFEIRDQIGWLFGSGFPKSKNLDGEWEGWGTALKPAWEPIVLARKPLMGTVATNVQQHGTGALNIDGCRVDGGERPLREREREGQYRPENFDLPSGSRAAGDTTLGRWPANIIHDGSDEVLAAFPQAPGQIASTSTRKTQNVYGAMKRGNGREGEASAQRVYGGVGATSFTLKPGARRGDVGSAARFFYCAKADRADRNEGLDGMPLKQSGMVSNTSGQHITRRDGGAPKPAANNHPTVKPTDLMRYLCRLVTPPGGTVLDPFMGSGSTLKAAELEGFNAFGIELDPAYVEIARRRIAADAPLFASVEAA